MCKMAFEQTYHSWFLMFFLILIKRNYTSLKSRLVRNSTKSHLDKESSGPTKVPTLFRDNSNKTSISKVQPENSYPESAPFFLSFCSRDTGPRQPTQMYMSALSVLPVRQ